MNTRFNFHFSPAQACLPIGHEHLPLADFDSLIRAFPDFKKIGKNWWEVSLREDDPRLAAIFEFTQNIGLTPYTCTTPWYRKVGNPKLFLVKKEHEFTKQEYDKAPFLEMTGEIEMGEHKHLHFDSPVLVRIKSKIPPIGYVEGGRGPVCTQSVKEAMEREGFNGFIFNAVVVECAKQPPEPLWEIWSDRMMPPSCSTLVNDDGTPVVPGRYENGCHPAECEHPQLYFYTPEAIHSMAGVDAAVTHEDFGPKTKLCEMRRLLVSQRFRQWALKNKLKLDYVPVLVREDLTT